MSSEDRSLRGTAVAAELAVVEQEWDELEDVAHLLLSIARQGQQGDLNLEGER